MNCSKKSQNNTHFLRKIPKITILLRVLVLCNWFQFIQWLEQKFQFVNNYIRVLNRTLATLCFVWFLKYYSIFYNLGLHGTIEESPSRRIPDVCWTRAFVWQSWRTLQCKCNFSCTYVCTANFVHTKISMKRPVLLNDLVWIFPKIIY